MQVGEPHFYNITHVRVRERIFHTLPKPFCLDDFIIAQNAKLVTNPTLRAAAPFRQVIYAHIPASKGEDNFHARWLGKHTINGANLLHLFLRIATYLIFHKSNPLLMNDYSYIHNIIILTGI